MNQTETTEITMLRVFLEDSEIERRAFCIKERISLGRDPYADVLLEDPTVSRLHFVIERERNRLVLQDRSSNGTWVNGRRVASCALSNRDVITAGRFTLIVEIQPDRRSSLYDQASEEGWAGEGDETIAWRRGSPRLSPSEGLKPAAG